MSNKNRIKSRAIQSVLRYLKKETKKKIANSNEFQHENQNGCLMRVLNLPLHLIALLQH